MAILSLAFKSLWNRKLTFFITLFSIAISVALLLGVQALKNETKTSFMKSISGTDLIVGARGASSQLLLSSVFHIGNTVNTIKYESYQEIAKSPAIRWAIPIALGDSHQGYTVMATELNFFEHFSYADKQRINIQSGQQSDDMFAVIIGADVAETLNYQVGDKIVVTHGNGEIDGHDHDNIPYFVSAILSPSFTAIDQTLIISLEAMEAMHNESHHYLSASSNNHDELASHENHKDHGEQESHANHKDQDEQESHVKHKDHDEIHHLHNKQDTREQRIARTLKIKPDNINAVFIGLTSPQAVLAMQNYINTYQAEPLTAIMPSIALQELWSFFSIAEIALNIVVTFVVLVGLLGMLSIILMSLNERRREMAILRSVGARPWHIFSLIIGEATTVCSIGIIVGITLLYSLLFLLQAPLANHFGFYLEISMLNINDLFILLAVQLSAMLIAIIPGLLIYKTSLSDGMNIKF